MVDDQNRMTTQFKAAMHKLELLGQPRTLVDCSDVGSFRSLDFCAELIMQLDFRSSPSHLPSTLAALLSLPGLLLLMYRLLYVFSCCISVLEVGSYSYDSSS